MILGAAIARATEARARKRTGENLMMRSMYEGLVSEVRRRTWKSGIGGFGAGKSFIASSAHQPDSRKIIVSACSFSNAKTDEHRGVRAEAHRSAKAEKGGKQR